MLELLEHKPVISNGYQAMIHIHTISENIEIKIIEVEYTQSPGGKVEQRIKPKFVKSGAMILVKIKCRLPVTLDKFDVIPQLG